MAAFTVIHYDTEPQNSVGEALQAIEAYIEGIVNTSTIYWCEVLPLSRDREKCVGYIVHKG